MKRNFTASAVAMILALSALGPPMSGADEGHGDLDFVNYMSRLQYFGHKLGLAVSAGNGTLQGYYIHEVEELVEKIAEIPEYKGIEVGRLVETVLEPKLEALEDKVGGEDQAAVDAAYDAFLGACNACHRAANHEFIVIERRRDDPYMQSFAPGP